VRKVNGANRFQIFIQFISESIILSLISLGCALVLLIVVKPFLLNLKFAQVLKWDLEGNLTVYAAFLGFSLFVGLMAGFFPAVILSRFEPIKVLKKIGSVKLFSRLTLRKSLLVLQFCLSLIFIISVLVVQNQLTLFMRADHGFDMSNKFVVKLNSTSYENLKRELDGYSSISNSAGASHVPAAGMVLGEGYKRDLADPEFISLDYYDVDVNYLENMSIELVAGRNFEASAGESNRNFILLNQQALKVLSFESAHNAIGETIFSSEDSSRYEIIGVVKDYNHEILVSKIGPMALRYRPESFSILQVQFAGDPVVAAADIEKAWTKVNPVQKIDYNDFEDEVRGFYKTVFSDFVSIIGVISFMAVAISCLGLLGMATYSIETRMKEISIRKVLGSTDKSLVLLLSKGFFVLLVIAILLAVPAAWFINNLWLQNIAYHTEVSLGVIGLSVLILFVLGTLTIGSQTLRAAYSNPVTNLKNE
jgi:putative ABC transport system permease protein